MPPADGCHRDTIGACVDIYAVVFAQPNPTPIRSLSSLPALDLVEADAVVTMASAVPAAKTTHGPPRRIQALHEALPRLHAEALDQGSIASPSPLLLQVQLRRRLPLIRRPRHLNGLPELTLLDYRAR
ncbi:hypothetical protein TRIUR3_35334 [Triticum urartu]|uniref:Uncharacterized protein n=1 Tax=Triticum urartu TaxID=4572 RepID=M8A5K9_TRIUA|nr:hypothetical protein TRIUR3_35334 [Triticum urartu]